MRSLEEDGQGVRESEGSDEGHYPEGQGLPDEPPVDCGEDKGVGRAEHSTQEALAYRDRERELRPEPHYDGA